MKLGIDISQIVHTGTGVARFTQGLTDAIFQYDHSNEWTFFFSSLRRKIDTTLSDKIENKGYKLTSQKIPPTLLTVLWNNLHMVKIERFTGNLDWFITSDWTEPPSSGNKATIVHDLTFLRYPETVVSSIRSVQEKRLRLVKKESKIIFTDSEATKKDLIDLLEIEPKRIVVNYPGVEVKVPTPEQITQTQFRYKLHNPFVLAVGKVEPRKNLKRLIQAFNELENSSQELVIVGPPGWETIDTPPNDKIRFLGYVNDTDLYALYALATGFIFPSIWEGFGYPAIEAMQLGCPVALSNNSSLGELGKGAALTFDPFDINAIKNALTTLIEDNKLRTHLIAEGKKKAKHFTWEKYYEKMIKTLL